MRLLLPSLITWGTLTLASPLQPRASQPQTCNGQASFCNRLYTNVSWIGTHDSAFVGSTADVRVNQEKNVTAQLDAGIRFLQAQTHKSLLGNTTLELCHTSCLLEDAGSLEAYLTTVKNWLSAAGNQNEVLTMLLTNGDSVDVSLFDEAFVASGLKQYAFVPSSSPAVLGFGAWPTYGQLIASGKRLVMFLDYGANAAKVPYILDEVSFPAPRAGRHQRPATDLI